MMKSLKKLTKLHYFIILSITVGILSIALPSLARYRNRLPIDISTVWDGSIATSYRKGTGTSEDPYVIASGAELAYFAQMLNTNNYENTYFVLNNDIVLNNGTFNYSNNGIEYSLNQSVFYIKEYTNEFYDNKNCEGVKIGTINLFSTFKNFKGHFDGKSHTIYGLYLTNSTENELAMFTNLQGSVQNLYLENAMIYGGNITAGIASSATNSTLKNILYNGYTIGQNNQINEIEKEIPDITLQLDTETKEENITIFEEFPTINGVVKTTILKGVCTTNNETSITINGQTIENCNEEFELELENVQNNLQIIVSSPTLSEVSLTNLNYSIQYQTGISAGIIGHANGVTLENVINKSYVYGKQIASGIIGITTNATIVNQSYNIGTIESNILATGLIGKITENSNNVSINKSYHAGITNASNVAGLIGIINENIGSITLQNTFNATSNYSFDTILNSDVSVENVYYQTGEIIRQGNINGDLIFTDQLKNKSTMIANLFFDEFIDFDTLNNNSSSVWVYEEDNYPVLYIDDVLNPVATLHVSTYSWNDIGFELKTLNFSSTLAFSIEQENDLKPLKEIYYFISNEKKALNKTEIEQLEWITYENVVEITEEGFYVIYAKVIDSNDNTVYLNSDLLVLDLSEAETTISLKNQSWNNLDVIENYTYINQTENLTIDAIDNLSGVNKIEYYITNNVVDDITTLDENLWTNYTEPISITNKGTYIIYAKVVDNCNHITYVNTNYIIYGGYEEISLTVGRNTSVTNYPLSITNQSSISFGFTYNDTNGYQEGYTHNLISNLLFPIHTKITLFDNKTNKIYVYEIETEEDIYSYNESCNRLDQTCEKIATYPFTLFKEVGKGSMDNLFVESTSGSINEDFTIFVDFKNTTITNNYSNLKLYMELHDKNGIPVRSTLQETLKTYNIFVNQSATPYIVNKYNGNSLVYNSNTTTEIPIEVGLLYKTINQQYIYDTTYENKILGLAIKLVDANDNIVQKQYLKNIRFKIGNKQYSPDNDGIIRISLENGLNTFNGNITIITEIGDNKLPSGNYNLKIYALTSYDGTYSNDLSSTVATIGVSANEVIQNTNYSFDVLSEEENQIISKEDTELELKFNILQNGDFTNPTVRISLYKKDKLTAYNQDYSKIDLQNYTNNTLEEIEDNTYYALKNPLYYQNSDDTYNYFQLNLNPSRFENSGYKLVFELYDGNKKIGLIEKKFIVK